MDLKIKDYFDNYRGSLPPEIKHKVKGVLFEDLETLNKWRKYRTSLKFKKKNVELSGLLDDLLVDNDIYIPLDYKTRGFAPKEDTVSYYQHQLDLYTFLLNKNNYKTQNVAYLVYYYPEKVERQGLVKFNVETKFVKTSIKSAEKLVDKAIKVLSLSEPKSHKGCVFCSYVASFERLD
jgi:CRISPR/Cas system-associated exonuclease Cas4 (RecB family)